MTLNKMACLFFVMVTTLTLWPTDNLYAIEKIGMHNKIACLRNGDIYLADLNGKISAQITDTGGKVGGYLFSPSLKYLAYTYVLRYEDEPGDYGEDEKIPKVPVYGIVIMNTDSRQIVNKLLPQKDESLDLEKWIPGEKLLYMSGSYLSVDYHFEYDVPNNSQRITDGLDSASEIDLPERGANIQIPCSSNNKKYIAWIDVNWKPAGQSKYSLVIYDLKKKQSRTTNEGSAPTTGVIGAKIAWSFDDEVIGIFYQKEAVLVKFQGSESLFKIVGSDFTWISNHKIAYVKDSDIHIYDADFKTDNIFLKKASQPFALR